MKQYDPQMCVEAEALYKQGNYEACLKLALEAHEQAKADAQEHWREMQKGPPTPLAALTTMWDTTTQRYLKYDEYLKSHNWEDDIPPGPMNIAEKAKKKLSKGR